MTERYYTYVRNSKLPDHFDFRVYDIDENLLSERIAIREDQVNEELKALPESCEPLYVGWLRSIGWTS